MRISFYNGIVMVLFAMAQDSQGIRVEQEANVDVEDIELAQFGDQMEEAPGVDGEMNLAQVGAEAMYFKKIVNFAKDAIKTIAPTLSTQNKLNAAAGVVRPLDNDINNKYTFDSGKPGLSKSMDHLSHNIRHPKPQSSISLQQPKAPRCSDLHAAHARRHHHQSHSHPRGHSPCGGPGPMGLGMGPPPMGMMPPMGPPPMAMMPPSPCQGMPPMAPPQMMPPTGQAMPGQPPIPGAMPMAGAPMGCQGQQPMPMMPAMSAQTQNQAQQATPLPQQQQQFSQVQMSDQAQSALF